MTENFKHQSNDRKPRKKIETINKRIEKKRLSRKKKTMKLFRNKFLQNENMNECFSNETLCDENREQERYKTTKRKKSDF